MLADDGTTVDANDITTWECLADDAKCLAVKVGLVVGRTEHGSVDNQEVSIGGWQPFSFVEDGSWHGQLQQPIGSAVKGTKCLQLLFHQLQFSVLFVVRIVAPYI